MDSDESTERSSPGPEPKVKRVIRDYELEGFDDRLVEGWLGEDGDRQSLRDLARELNKAILRAAMRESGIRPLDGEVENLYRLLTSDEVTSAQRTEAETRLERAGLDPGTLRRDFVSHQAVHTHLREHRGIRLPGSDEPGKKTRTAENIQKIAGRLRTITERSLDGLSNEDVTVGDPDVFVSIQVYCDDCGRQFDVEELFSRGGCDCESP